MKNGAELPIELVEFLNRPTPQSLVLRGAPGTGKTLLALALLDAFPGRGIYVTTRVSRSSLDLDLPDLGRMVRDGRITVIDISAEGSDLRAAVRALGSSKELLAPGESSRSLRSLLLPPEVLRAWSEISSTAPTMVVLDSWDAIVERHVDIPGASSESLPTRAEVERIAVAQMTDGPVFLVMVIENREAGQLEYLVNGIVTTEREVHEDRLERWLRIDKLRGTRVARSSYPFSLEGGRFQCIVPMGNRAPDLPLRIDPRPPSLAGQLWPGSSDYASFFGAIPVGKLTLVELDAWLSNLPVQFLLAPLLSDVVARGGRVLHVPPPAMQPPQVWDLYGGTVSRETFLRQVRLICVPPTSGSEEFAPIILPLPSGETMADSLRVPEAERFLRDNRDPEKPNLVLLSMMGMTAINTLVPGSFTAATVPGMILHFLQVSPAHGIFVGYTDDPLTRVIRPMVSTHIRLVDREGRIFVHGVNPRTPSLVLSPGDEQSPYHLRLVV